MIDTDLAVLYGVPTKALVQAVKRNPERFPEDFSFQLDREEFDRLRSQIVTSNPRGGRRYPPYAFTEQGVAMPSGVLNSPRAIAERRYDAQFKIVFDAIRELIAPPRRTARRVGFRAGDETTR
jgi:hypothetical protein